MKGKSFIELKYTILINFSEFNKYLLRIINSYFSGRNENWPMDVLSFPAHCKVADTQIVRLLMKDEAPKIFLKDKLNFFNKEYINITH